jgi:elongation factor Ts
LLLVLVMAIRLRTTREGIEMTGISAQVVKELRDKSGAGMMDCKKALAETGGDIQKAMQLLRERGAAIASKRSSRVAKEGLIACSITPDGKTGALVELNCESDFVARNDEFRAATQRLADHAVGVEDMDRMSESVMEPEGVSVADQVQKIVGSIGENIVLTRCMRFKVGEGGRPDGILVSYIHPPGKIGVIVDIAAGQGAVPDTPGLVEFARDVAMHVAASAPVAVTREEVPEDLVAQEREIYRNQALNEGKPEKIVEKIVDGKMRKYYADVCLLEQPFVKNPDQQMKDYVEETAKRLGLPLGVTRFVRWKLGETVSE